MAVNKVIINTAGGEQTLIDLTGDSVTPETLAEGVTAHDASGAQIVGTMQAGGGGGGSGESALDEFLRFGISGAYRNDRLESLREYVFAGSGSLTSADFANVIYIDQHAFNYCYELNVLVLRTTAGHCLLGSPAESTFEETKIQYGQGIILVPRDLIDAYQANDLWDEFADYFRALEDYTVDGTISGEIDWALVEEELASIDPSGYTVWLVNDPETGDMIQTDMEFPDASGMLWQEFVQSELNADGLFALSDDGMYVLYNNEWYVTFPDGTPLLAAGFTVDVFDRNIYLTHRDMVQGL